MIESKRETLLADLRRIMEGCASVASAYLFGSVARDEESPISDVDVAVLPVPGLTARQRARLVRDLIVRCARASPGHRFDLRLLDELPIAIAGRILAEGTLVADNDPLVRVREEVRLRALYFDFLPFEREAARDGLRHLRAVTGHG